MNRISLLSLVLVFVAAVAFGAPRTPALQSTLAAPTAPMPVAAFLASLAKGEDTRTMLAPDGAPYGAHFVDVDWECVSWCQQDYMQCAQGCSACDQCSCQLAYCSASCGIPFQGC